MTASAKIAAVLAAPVVIMATSYVVRPGDTLGDIAWRHGTTVADLVAVNELSDATAIRVGQLLQIPDSSMSLPRYVLGADDIENHAVTASESVFSVARSYGVDPTALGRTNSIGVNAELQEGAVLQIPGRLARANAMLNAVSEEVGADASLVRSVAWIESQWQQQTVSPTGAVGIMQLEPYTGEWISQYLAGSQLNLRIAKDNVTAGALLLNHLATLHSGDINAAVAAYYQGDQSIARNGLFFDTKQYQRAISTLMNLE